MQHSIIQKSQLEGAKRIDAEYFQLEYLNLISDIKVFKYRSLKEAGCKVVSGPFGSSLKSDAYLSAGIPFIRINDLGNFFTKDGDLIYISNGDNDRLKQSQLFPYDIVLSKVGNTIGVASAVPEEFAVCNISENNIGIKFSKDFSLKYKLFILTYLNSQIGLKQVLRSISGNAQPKINIHDIENIIFPIPSNSILESNFNLINTAKQSVIRSEVFYQQAEDLLLKELGLKDFQVEDDLSYIVNFSDVSEANRIDAEYFQPKYEKLIDQLQSQSAKPFMKVVENIAARFNPKPDESYKYVDLGNINSSNGIIDGSEEVLGKEAPSRAKRILKENDVIVSSVEGSLNKVALVAGSQNGYIASNGFFQFRSEEVLPEVLLMLTKSIVMQWQMKKHCVGTILTAVPSEALNKMTIPVLPMEKQQEIAELVRKSHEARKKSKELLEEAKRKVEEMIEKD